MSKDTLDDILGVAATDEESSNTVDTVESDKPKADTETSSDVVVKSNSQDETKASNVQDAVEDNSTETEGATDGTETEGATDGTDEDTVDGDVCESENVDKPSHMFLRKPVPLYRVPNSNSAITMISGRVTVTGEAKQNFLPVQYTKYGVGKLTGYIITHSGKDI